MNLIKYRTFTSLSPLNLNDSKNINFQPQFQFYNTITYLKAIKSSTLIATPPLYELSSELRDKIKSLLMNKDIIYSREFHDLILIDLKCSLKANELKKKIESDGLKSEYIKLYNGKNILYHFFKYQSGGIISKENFGKHFLYLSGLSKLANITDIKKYLRLNTVTITILNPPGLNKNYALIECENQSDRDSIIENTKSIEKDLFQLHQDGFDSGIISPIIDLEKNKILYNRVDLNTYDIDSSISLPNEMYFDYLSISEKLCMFSKEINSDITSSTVLLTNIPEMITDIELVAHCTRHANGCTGASILMDKTNGIHGSHDTANAGLLFFDTPESATQAVLALKGVFISGFHIFPIQISSGELPPFVNVRPRELTTLDGKLCSPHGW